MFSEECASLQYLVAVRVTITVCESEDMQCLIGRFRRNTQSNALVGFLDGQWKQLRSKARRMFETMYFPDVIINIILEKLWPISFEVYKWISFHSKEMGICRSPNFCWTPQANIDYENTARMLVKNETLDVKKRFEMACLYCLEQDVRSLWDAMNLPARRYFYVRGSLKDKKNPIILYWTYYIQDVPEGHWDSRAVNDFQLFKYAVKSGYLSATKFFFAKFRIPLRSRMISSCFRLYLGDPRNPECVSREHSAIAYFLNCELRLGYDGVSSFTMFSLVYRYFLEWPMQKHFLTFARRMRQHLTFERFGELLQAILEKDISGFKDYDYKMLFIKFWITCPQPYKTYVNTISLFGCKILIKFVTKHFGFVFDKKPSILQKKFREVVLFKDSKDDTYFEKLNVFFLRILVLERVATNASIDRLEDARQRRYPLQIINVSLFDGPLEELRYILNSILGSP